MPQLGATTRTTVVGGRVMGGSSAIVRGTQVTGGEVNRVSRRDSLFYEWHGPHLRLLLQGDDSIMRAAGAKVELDGTDYEQRADVDGRVDLSPVLAGRYKAKIHTALMDSLGMPPVDQDVEVRDGTRVDTLRLPRARDLLAVACRDSVSRGEGMLRGRAVDQQRKPLKQAAVVVMWQTDFSIIGGASGDQMNRKEKTIGSFSDDSGNWRICGVPRQVPLFVSVTVDAGSAFRKTELAGEFGAVDLELGSGATTRADEAMIGAGAMGRRAALVEVAVFNPAGAPVPEVTVDVEPPSGPSRRVVTGATGRALIPEIAPGLLKVKARRVGYKEGQVAVTVDARPQHDSNHPRPERGAGAGYDACRWWAQHSRAPRRIRDAPTQSHGDCELLARRHRQAESVGNLAAVHTRAIAGDRRFRNGHGAVVAIQSRGSVDPRFGQLVRRVSQGVLLRDHGRRQHHELRRERQRLRPSPSPSAG